MAKRLDEIEIDRSILHGRNKFAESAERRGDALIKAENSVDLGIQQYKSAAYEAAIKNITVGLAKGAKENSNLWLVLARCNFKIWAKSSDFTRLQEAHSAYSKALTYPEISNDVDII